MRRHTIVSLAGIVALAAALLLPVSAGTALAAGALSGLGTSFTHTFPASSVTVLRLTVR